MASDNVFGSDELTPELLRSASFDEQDGKVDVAEVRTFLDRIASSVEVFLSQDAPTALRAEFSRNASIAQQVLDAGQNASEQLRRQAAEDAKRILDEAREATLHLRGTVETEIEQSRVQVESMRGQFIQDLRDLYDRIGASLYRFERAADDATSAMEPIAEPTRDPAATAAPAVEALAPSEVADVAPDLPAPHPDLVEPELPEGAKAPAWQQLPAQAWADTPVEVAPTPAPTPDPVSAPEPGPDAFAVVEDEPLAPGEPLVDLRELQGEPAASSPEVAETVGDDLGGSWLEASAAADPAAPAEAPAEAAPLPGDAGASWLDPGAVPDHSADPSLAHDEALAEAIIGPSEPEAQPMAPTVDPAVASADAVAVRQVILDSLAAGQTRETVEAYLRDQMGLLEPGALVDAALASGNAPS